MSLGKSHQSQQSQNTSTQAFDPQIKGAILGNYANAQNLVANTPSQYNGQLIAPMNATQNAGNQDLLGVANSGVGNDTLNSAIGTTGGLANFNPDQVQAGQLAGTDLSPYFNPYNSEVTARTLQDLQRQNQMANVANDQSATSAGAFGGDRSAVLNALTNEGYARTGANTLANLNQANYGNAQQGALADIAARQAAATSNQGANIQGAGIRQNAGTNLAAMSGQQLSQSTALANLIRQVGAQYQNQDQSQLDASRNQFQTNLGNKVTLQQLIDQALGLAGNSALTQSQGTGSGSGYSMSFAALK